MNVPYVKVEEKVPWLQHTAEKYTYGQSRNEQTYCKTGEKSSGFSPVTFIFLHPFTTDCTALLKSAKFVTSSLSHSSVNKDRFPQLLCLLWTQHSSWLILPFFMCLILALLWRCGTCMAKSQTLWHLSLWCSLEDLFLTLQLMYIWITWPFIASFTP